MVLGIGKGKEKKKTAEKKVTAKKVEPKKDVACETEMSREDVRISKFRSFVESCDNHITKEELLAAFGKIFNV